MTATVLLYTVYGLAAVLVLGVAAVLLTLILGALRLAVRWLRRADPYEPAASERPMGCGCVFRNVQYTCLKCGDSRCDTHRDEPHACSDAAFADVQRVFAGAVDRDGDLLAEPFEAQLYDAIRRYRAGEDIESGASRERP